MALIKRGRVWVFDFYFQGKRHQGSTHHTNKEEAQKWVRAFRTNLVNTGVGLVQPKAIPSLTEFLDKTFRSHIEQNQKTEGTKVAYRRSIKRFLDAPCFQSKRLDQITATEINEYKKWRLEKQNTPATINGDLAVLRKALRWADWGLRLIRYPGVSSLPGASCRTFVLSGELENEYLSVVPYPLKQVAILMLDLGLRPEEAVSLRKSATTDLTVSVESGKTANARRQLPQTQRTLEVFKFLADVFPDSPWVFPGRQGKHLTAHAVSNLHGLIRNQVNEAIAVASPIVRTSKTEWPVDSGPMSTPRTPWPEEFVLYALRHTYGSRLAESGARGFEIKALMGHHSVVVSEKYIHPSADHLTLTAKRAEAYGRMLRGEMETQHDIGSAKEGLKT